ncbi:PfkB family carbohydrate kinase [Thalassobaculum salexigens]|uniref:PfkB family carbohydrate kinase n=1 Tax=Thalassobaculum salexigens TaxID=455360 RepID=UPI0003FE3EA4|nr:PfkB family carbohydrate kinase [Thalassobaculum salexigens]
MTAPSPTQPPANAAAKINTLEDIGKAVEMARAEGRRVVLAHGVFDILHIGHIRHLEEARSHGDLLVVSVTPDRFVNKGPGRPVFGELVRAEMLAALSFVDHVGLNVGPTAEPAIQAIKPDVYVKGSDYADMASDVTGKIVDERRAVERFGGKVVFTDDVTHSSSSLINRFFNPFEPHVRQFVEGLRARDEQQEILDLIDRVETMRILVVGDAIIDEYRYVTPMGRAPKENLVTVLNQSSEVFAGGVFATANHVSTFCRQVDVLTVFGAQDSYREFVEGKLNPNVGLIGLERSDAPTTRKSRYIDAASVRKLFETYHMVDKPVADDVEQQINGRLAEIAGGYDVVIVNDFGHGMIKPSTIDMLTRHARFLAVNTQTNSANYGFNLITKYPRPDYICIDALEARLAIGDQHGSVEDLITRGLALQQPKSKIAVTHGRIGCQVYAPDEATTQIPAFADRVADTMGAGDAFLAITAPLVAAGGRMRTVGFLGNIAGAIQVGIVGHRTSVDKVMMIKAVISMLK